MAKDNAQSSFQRGVMSLLILSLLDTRCSISCRIRA